MFRNQSADVHAFSMIPKAQIPRSSFRIQHTHKTTFDGGYLVPVYVDEVLPGDTFSLRMTAFCRMATPIFPVMDNMYMDSFFFFVPNRLVWTNWVKMMGEQDNPADSTSYITPYLQTGVGMAVNSIYDYMGIPTVGQVTEPDTWRFNALPFRAYNLIYKEWFRDENLQNSPVINKDDGPDDIADYALLRRGKRHDYFTAALPWTQKGTAVSLPLTGNATVRTNATALITGSQNPGIFLQSSGGATLAGNPLQTTALGGLIMNTAAAGTPFGSAIYPANLYADLSTATNVTINALRQAFQIQRLLERDARGGTRYTEIIFQHFGVKSPDARLQRPEYLGGGSTPININPVAQTSGTGVTGSTSPQGNLSAFGTALAKGHGFTQSFTEHGHVIGLVSVRADLTYQQGMRKMWSRAGRFDYYWPVFQGLGEQAILNQEIYLSGDVEVDQAVFGYQERYAEYRYHPSRITGLMKSTSAGTIDNWHLAQRFTALPTLNSTFIEDRPPIDRIVAVGEEANGQQFLGDFFFDCRAARPLPMYGVPGMIDHF